MSNGDGNTTKSKEVLRPSPGCIPLGPRTPHTARKQRELHFWLHTPPNAAAEFYHPGICAPDGGSRLLWSFSSKGGSTDFSLKTLASSSPFSVGFLAQSPSCRLSGGMLSCPVAFRSKEPLNFHQPRDEGDISISSARTLPMQAR